MSNAHHVSAKRSLIQLFLFYLSFGASARRGLDLFIIKPGESTYNDSRAIYDLAEGGVHCQLDMPSLDKVSAGSASFYSIWAFAAPGRAYWDLRNDGLEDIDVALLDNRSGTIGNLVFINNNGKRESAYSNDLLVSCYQSNG